MHLYVDAHSQIPIRRQLAEQLKHFIESGGFPREQALPSIREMAGFLGINPNTVARVIEDLKRDGYVQVRRGKGVFVVPDPPTRLSPTLREAFLKEVGLRAGALGMTADDVAVGLLSLAGVHPAVVKPDTEVLLVECSQPELDFFARELQAHLPVRVDKVRLRDLATAVRRRTPARRWWGAAVTSFFHLPEVERVLAGMGIPVIALLAEAHLETLHRLAQLLPGTRVGVASVYPETAHNLEHSITNAGLANIELLGTCPAEGAALGRLVRQAQVMVCSSLAAERVRALINVHTQVIIDDRTLDRRTIDLLAATLARQDQDREAPTAAPAAAKKLMRLRPAKRSSPASGATRQPPRRAA